MTTPTPAVRRARARLGALTRIAAGQGPQMAQAARRGFLARFDREADPEGVLPPAVRQQRAEALLKLYMAKLSLARAKKAAKKGGR